MTTVAETTIREDAHSRDVRLAGYDVVRVLLGLLLLTSAYVLRRTRARMPGPNAVPPGS